MAQQHGQAVRHIPGSTHCNYLMVLTSNALGCTLNPLSESSNHSMHHSQGTDSETSLQSCTLLLLAFFLTASSDHAGWQAPGCIPGVLPWDPPHSFCTPSFTRLPAKTDLLHVCTMQSAHTGLLYGGIGGMSGFWGLNTGIQALKNCLRLQEKAIKEFARSYCTNHTFYPHDRDVIGQLASISVWETEKEMMERPNGAKWHDDASKHVR